MSYTRRPTISPLSPSSRTRSEERKPYPFASATVGRARSPRTPLSAPLFLSNLFHSDSAQVPPSPTPRSFKRSSSTSALSRLSHLEGEETDRSPVLLRSLSAKASLAQPSLDTTPAFESDCAGFGRSRSESTVSTLSDFVSVLSRRSTLSDEGECPATPTTAASPLFPHGILKLPKEKGLTPPVSAKSEPTSPAPHKRGRSNTVNFELLTPRKASGFIKHIRSSSAGKLGALVTTSPPASPLSKQFASPPQTPTAPSPTSSVALSSKHSPFIDSITVTYNRTQKCANMCRQLIPHLTSLSKSTQSPRTLCFKVTQDVKESGNSLVTVMYKDGTRLQLPIQADEQLFTNLTGRISVHAEFLLSQQV